jgi:hypothetical protein
MKAKAQIELLKLTPLALLMSKQGVTPEPDPESGNREYYTTGLEIEVRDKPRTVS